MIGLLKADFRRLFKDKLLLVMGILAVVFALTMPLLYAVLFSVLGMSEEDMQMMAALGFDINAKTLFFSSFSLGNDLGLIVPVLLAIALWKDFSYGTVRNKIIAGKSRSAIFMSLFITCAVTFIAVMLLHALITLGVSLIFFPYQRTAFAIEDLWYFLVSVLFEILMLAYVAAFLSWLCASMKNVGLVIVLYIAYVFLMILTSSIMEGADMAIQFFADEGWIKEWSLKLLKFFDRINVLNAVSYIGMGTSYNWKDWLYLTVPAGLGITGFLGLGLWQFNRKDLK